MEAESLDDRRQREAEEQGAEGAAIDVAEGRMGVVIGKAGATIKRLESSHGVRIQAVRGGKAVVVQGEEDAAVEACRLEIEALLNPAEEQMEIPEGRMGAVIGRGGETVRELEKAHYVRIDTDKGSSTLTIKGSHSCIENAREAIEEICEAEDGAGGYNGGGGDGEEMELPEGTMGMVIGKGGAKTIDDFLTEGTTELLERARAGDA